MKKIIVLGVTLITGLMILKAEARAEGQRYQICVFDAFSVPQTLQSAVNMMDCVLDKLSNGNKISPNDEIELVLPLRRKVNDVKRLLRSQPSAATPQVSRALRKLVDQFCEMEAKVADKGDIGMLADEIEALTLAEAVIEEQIHYWSCHGQ